MRSLRVGLDGRRTPRLEALALPFLAPGPTATARDLELAPDSASMTAVRQVRAIAVPAGAVVARDGGARRLYVVVAGSLEVDVPAMHAALGPGDVLFVDLPPDEHHPVRLRAARPCSYLEVEVEDAWVPTGTVPPALTEGRRSAATAPRLLRMASDGRVAHLTRFGELFAASGQPQGVSSLSFVCLSPGMRSDWHTEPGVSLLVVLAGGFELEVGGLGSRRTLRAGDACLVEDFDGRGHTSGSDGETRFVVLSLPHDHRWTTTRKGTHR